MLVYDTSVHTSFVKALADNLVQVGWVIKYGHWLVIVAGLPVHWVVTLKPLAHGYVVDVTAVVQMVVKVATLEAPLM